MQSDEILDDVHIRILRVTEDLRSIQQALNCAAMQAPNDPELMEALCQLPELESLHLLKTALDQMRHFLWFYMQVMTNGSEEGERMRESIRQKPSGNMTVSPHSRTSEADVILANPQQIFTYKLLHPYLTSSIQYNI
jgi:hypothetical protein